MVPWVYNGVIVNRFRPPVRSSFPRESVYASRHLAEVVEFLSGAETDVGEVGIRRFQTDTTLVASIGLHGEVSIHAGDDDVAVSGAEGTVDHQQVAVAIIESPSTRTKYVAAGRFTRSSFRSSGGS